jgi:hypothetical protein
MVLVLDQIFPRRLIALNQITIRQNLVNLVGPANAIDALPLLVEPVNTPFLAVKLLVVQNVEVLVEFNNQARIVAETGTSVTAKGHLVDKALVAIQTNGSLGAAHLADKIGRGELWSSIPGPVTSDAVEVVSVGAQHAVKYRTRLFLVVVPLFARSHAAFLADLGAINLAGMAQDDAV